MLTHVYGNTFDYVSTCEGPTLARSRYPVMYNMQMLVFPVIEVPLVYI